MKEVIKLLEKELKKTQEEYKNSLSVIKEKRGSDSWQKLNKRYSKKEAKYISELSKAINLLQEAYD